MYEAPKKIDYAGHRTIWKSANTDARIFSPRLGVDALRERLEVATGAMINGLLRPKYGANLRGSFQWKTR
jgi:hypothetical protein